MRLLLTDSGVTNASIMAALVELLGGPVSEADALCIPTAGHGGPYGDPGGPWRFVSGRSPHPMTGVGRGTGGCSTGESGLPVRDGQLGWGSHSGALPPRGRRTSRKRPGVRDMTTWSVTPW
jgi:hypothetical protein